jgi:hypothetical protein
LLFLLCAAPLAAQPTMDFRQLPKEACNHAIAVRKSCKELDPEMRFNDMQGIQILDLKGDGSRNIFVEMRDFAVPIWRGLIAQIAVAT